MGDSWVGNIAAGSTRTDHRIRAVQFVTATGWTRQAMEAEEKRERRRRQRQKVVSCCKKFAAFLFSHIGLAAMVVAYSIMGGFLFQWLEASAERREKVNIIDAKEGAIKIILRQGQLYCGQLFNKSNYEDDIRGQLVWFQKQIIVAIRDKGWDGNDDIDDDAVQWSFAGALLYALTVITTIGYGHVAPKTTPGRMVTILYALVGIPLTFLYLSNIGNFLADVFRLFYKKICCDILCCKKCERKKKQERLKLRRRRELAAQRNTILGVTEGMSSYGAADDTVVAITAGDNAVPSDENSSRHELSGGGDNFAFELGGDGLDLEQNDSPELEAAKTSEVELSDRSLLSLVNEDLRETDILDDDTDTEGEKLIGDVKPGTPNSEMHVSRTILDKLDDAKETAILESEDDGLKIDEPKVRSRTRSLEEVHSDAENTIAMGNTNNKSVPCRSKSEKRPKKQEIRRSFFSSKKPKRDGSKERSRSKEKAGNKVKTDKPQDKTPSKKDKGTDKKKEAKSKEIGKNPKLQSKKVISISDPQLAAILKDSETSKLKKEPSRKGRAKSVLKDSGCKNAGRSRALRRSASAKIILNPQDTTAKGDSKTLSHTLPRSKSFQQSDDSFVTAYGDSLSQLAPDREGSDSEVELITMNAITPASNKQVENSNQPSHMEITIDDNNAHLDEIELADFNVLKDKLNFVDDPFDYEDDDSHDKVTVPISVCLILITSYILAGSVLFMVWEDWDLITGSYFCFITLSTIGFGDIVPGTAMGQWDKHEKLVLCALWLAFGLSLLAMCFNLMQEEVKEKVKWVGHRIGLLRDEVES